MLQQDSSAMHAVAVNFEQNGIFDALSRSRHPRKLTPGKGRLIMQVASTLSGLPCHLIRFEANFYVNDKAPL